jgi:cytochrome c-type biogenesis protein CcmH
MIGWLPAILLASTVFGGLLLLLPRRKQLWPVVAAAVVLGLAGYAWQGAPEQPASPAQPIPAKLKAADALLQMRADMDTGYGIGKQWLITADSYARSGKYDYSAAFIQSGLRQYPKNGDLWAGLGVVLLLAGDGQMSPPAKMAFANARKFGPRNPAPDYFAGLVELFEGRPAKTVEIWQRIVDSAPDKAIWRRKLESQLIGLKTMLQSVQPTDVNKDK